MVGLINEMAGEQGFAWHCRVILLTLGRVKRSGRSRRQSYVKEYGYDVTAEQSISTADSLEGLYGSSPI